MQIVTLVSRQLRNAPFWGQIINCLTRKHHFVMRPIELTPSTPGDLTFPQLNLSALFISTSEVDDEQMNKVRALSSKQRNIVLVVRSIDDSRAWERVQLQLVVADLSVVVIPAMATETAAHSIAILADCFSSNVCAETPDMRSAAELLRHLDLDDERLQYVYERTSCLSDLATIVSTPDNRAKWAEELSEPIVEAIESLLLPDNLIPS